MRLNNSKYTYGTVVRRDGESREREMMHYRVRNREQRREGPDVSKEKRKKRGSASGAERELEARPKVAESCC